VSVTLSPGPHKVTDTEPCNSKFRANRPPDVVSTYVCIRD
ncbi:hypothetical protein LEMLEM_LOCUS3745, partial [Lemmus lemmus]